MLQRPSCDVMRQALTRTVHEALPEVRPTRLERPPVVGAALLALDLLRRNDPARVPALADPVHIEVPA